MSDSPQLRLVTDDERVELNSDPDDDPDLGDFISVAEREAEVNKLFAAAFESPEARLNPWPDPEASAVPDPDQSS